MKYLNVTLKSVYCKVEITFASLMSDEDLRVCFSLTLSELFSFTNNPVSSEGVCSNDA